MNILRILAPAVLATALAPAAPAQDLQELHDAYQRDRLELVREGASFEDIRARTVRFTDRLRRFLEEDARGADRFNARLMLVDYLLSLGERDRAIGVLTDIEVGAAPAMALASAAEFATHLGMQEERERWIDAALEKDEDFEQRMALAMALATRLLAPERAQEVFAQALEAAASDEERARVRWYEAAAVREREDLTDEDYEQALRALAGDFPDTRWGSIARDRLRAREFEVGAEAVPFEARALDGSTVRLADYAGQVLLLDFWASWCGPCREASDALVSMVEDYRDRGFRVVGISMDDDCDATRRAIAEDGRTWPVVCTGEGARTELALRYDVDLPPRMILIGRDGEIAALHLFPFDEEGVADMREQVEAALEQPAK